MLETTIAMRERMYLKKATTNYWRDYYQFKLEEVEKTEEEKFNSLTEILSRKELPLEIVRSGLSSFAKTAQGDGYSFLKLDLQNKDLYSLKGIDKFKHLQQINISLNNITSLEPLSAHRCLVNLNVSHNILKNLAHFRPADVLVRLNLSFNKFERIPSFSSYTYLRELYMNDNLVKELKGVNDCKSLTTLDLSNNSIEVIEGLNKLKLKELYLQGNKIVILSGMKEQNKLQVLNLARNGIRKLDELNFLDSLRFLDLSSNRIKKLKELDCISSLPYLTDLDLCQNACQNTKFFRIQVVYKIPILRVLDGTSIIAKDLVEAENFFGHSIQDKREIFNSVLENETFVDRRLFSSYMLDPESTQEPIDCDFFDKYDENGKKIERRPQYLSNNTKYPFHLTGSTKLPDHSAISMQFVCDNFAEMQQAIKRNKVTMKGKEYNLALGKMIPFAN